MSRIEKKLQSMLNNPRGDWRMSDLEGIADKYGITYRQPGTSHVTFRTKDGRMLTVPAHKPIKPVYIKMFIELVNNYGEDE